MPGTKSWKYVALYGALAVPFLALAIQVTRDRRSECQQAQSWVEAHHLDLPTQLGDVTAFPGVYRRAIFGAHPAVIKTELWQTWLTEVLKRPLRPAQHKLVEEAFAIVSPELYRTREVPVVWQTHIKKEFTPEEIRDIFKSLGPRHGSFASFDSSLVLLKRRWNQLATAWARPPCNCAAGEDCSASSPGCSSPCRFDYGCGYFGSASCSGACAVDCL